LIDLDQLEKFRTVHGNRYDYSRVDWKNARTPIQIGCPDHGSFSQLPMNHMKGSGCPRCAGVKRRLTTAEYLVRARQVHGEKYDYSRLEYVRNALPVTVICAVHGEFHPTATSHLQGRGCPGCASVKKTATRGNWASKLLVFREVHGTKYEYDETSFKRMRDKIRIRCPKHGWFEQTPGNHTTRGCDRCGGTRTTSTEEFIKKAQAVHGLRYDYSRVNYVNNRTLVTLVCPEHGEFEQRPVNHVNMKRGCWKCTRSFPSDTPGFVEKAERVHQNRYTYENTEYVRSGDPVTITCPKHGPFLQAPENHLSGNACPVCSNGCSEGEREVYEWILQQEPTARTRVRDVIPPMELDIYIPEKNLAIEYCGLYWHSDAGGKDHRYHLNKHLLCEEKGIRLITLFEDEWQDHPERVKATLGHFLGNSPPGVYARKTTIQEISWAEAKTFLERHHLLGAGTAGQKRIGAYSEGILIGVMVYGMPGDERRNKSDAIEMKRFVTDGRNHPGLGSKMFKWAITHYGYTKVSAFVDRRWFTGSFKSLSGFVRVGETPPTLFWTKQKKRYHRRFITKKRSHENGTLLPGETKIAMMRRLGYSRIWDCGKLKLEWNA